MDFKAVEAGQREHYDKIGADYDTHYSDRWSLAYREEFLCAPMFIGVDLQGLSTLDALCGGGQLATYMQKQGAEVWGLDISSVQIESLKERCDGIHTVVGSVFEMPFEDESFDVIGICNALHHLHPHIEEAIKEIHRVLKPGGRFGFSEPAGGTLPDYLRQIWYRFDPLFEESEAAVDIESLKSTFEEMFEFRHEVYVGNVAYICVLNSMVLRLPTSWKRWYSPLLMKLERVLVRFLPRFLSCAVVCSWRKRGVAVDS